MAIINPTTSGAAISQGQGQGFAQVFGQSSFDPVVFTQNIAKQQEARRVKELDDEMKTREKNAKVQVVMPEGSLYGEDEIYKAVEEGNKQLAKFAALGIDIESSPEGRAILNKQNAEVKSLAGADKTVQERFKHFQDLAQQNPGKYDKEKLNEWIKQTLDIKGVKGQAKFAIENSPWEAPEYDLNDLYKGIADTIGEVTQKIPGGAETMWPEESVGELTKTYIMGMPEDERQAAFEAGKKQGLWSNFPEMLEATKKTIIPMGSVKRTFQAPSSGGGGFSMSVGGYKVPEKINAQVQEKDPVTGEAVSVSVTYNDQDIKPMEVRGRDGKTLYFKPAADAFYRVGGKNKSGLKQGDFGVKGKVFRRSNEQIVNNDEKATLEQFMTNPNAIVSDNGNGTSTVTTFVPLSDEVVSWDANSATFKTHLNNFDVKEFVSGWNKTNSKGSSSAQPKASAPKFDTSIDPN